MDISTNRISLTFDDTERMEKKNVSVQDAKDGGISQIQVGATMDCSVQEAGKHHIVYTEAEAKQLKKQKSCLPKFILVLPQKITLNYMVKTLSHMISS